METKKICPYHKNNFTETIRIFRKDKLTCKVKNCPYGNLDNITLSGEPITSICRTNGYLKEIKVYNLNGLAAITYFDLNNKTQTNSKPQNQPAL